MRDAINANHNRNSRLCGRLAPFDCWNENLIAYFDSSLNRDDSTASSCGKGYHDDTVIYVHHAPEQEEDVDLEAIDEPKQEPLPELPETEHAEPAPLGCRSCERKRPLQLQSGYG